MDPQNLLPPVPHHSQTRLITLIIILFIVIAAALGAWYWQSTNTPTPEVTPVPVATADPMADLSADEAGWQTYRDEEYGFELEFTDIWKGFRVETSIVGNEKNIANVVFEIPHECSSDIDRCSPWIAPFYIQIFPIATWQELQLEVDFSEPEVIAENSNYVFTLRQNDLPKSVEIDFGIAQILSTFRFLD